jgi:hypothetical protein
MNEVLIKELVKLKLNAADAIISNLPPKVSEEIKSLGRIILESVNESCKDMKGQEASKVEHKDKLDNVPIE